MSGVQLRGYGASARISAEVLLRGSSGDIFRWAPFAEVEIVEQARQSIEERMWTVAEVAAYLSVSKWWVRRRVHAGLMPGYMYPGSRPMRFDPSEVRAYARGEWRPAAKSA